MKEKNHSMEKNDYIEEERQKEKKRSIGKFEKIFWVTILIFAVIFIILKIMGYVNHSKVANEDYSEPVISTKTIYTIIEDNEFLKKNLGNSKAIKILEDNLEEKRQKLDLVIDKQIEKSFSVAYDNIDTFLDYHYSVIGEYSELIASATGSIAQDVKENLFGNEFISNMKKSQTLINDTYIENIRAHITEIDKQATKGISRSLNSDILTKLTSDIENRFSAQYIKLGSIIVAGTSIKVVSLVSAKIAAKSGGKLAAKLAAKTTLKTASAGTAAVAGAACGPFVWVCSPVAGLAAWFGTDAIIISGDEYFNRDDFKREIVQMLDKQKIELSTKVKNAYAEKLVTDSISIRRNYESTTIKREKISEKI